jgi:uncharacterized protein YkwD
MKPIRSLSLLLLILALLVLSTPARSQGSCRFYGETGRQICDRLLEYWDANGALPVFGYPISDQAGQPVESRTFQAQLFERNRLELHPENARPYDVLLGRLGADALNRAGRDWTTFPKGDPAALHYFAETGHAIAPQFWGYWSSHGLEFDGQPSTSFAESLALFGMPLSEAAMEVNPTDGQQYLTQWFERARFEYHPENAGTPYAVLLGLLGAELSNPGAPPAPLPAFAAQVIDLVNQQRAAAGCPALVANDALMSIAQAHSQDMATHDFFQHEGSDGRTPFQRMNDAGYRYRRAAENIAAGPKRPADAVALWMNSPPHRANILDCALRETGVGYVDDPGDPLKYGSYWTQDFGTR